MTHEQRRKLADALQRQGPSPAKAREILHDGTVHGKAITEKQRRFFGARASGQPVRR